MWRQGIACAYTHVLLNYLLTLNTGRMKKIFLVFSVVLMLVILLGADIRREKEAQVPVIDKLPCKGYTIIEFGKGINCDGDTVKLVKVEGGGQQLARLHSSE